MSSNTSVEVNASSLTNISAVDSSPYPLMSSIICSEYTIRFSWVSLAVSIVFFWVSFDVFYFIIGFGVLLHQIGSVHGLPWACGLIFAMMNICWAIMGGLLGIDKWTMRVYVVSNACYSAQKNEVRDVFKDLKLNFISKEFYIACVALGRMFIFKSSRVVVGVEVGILPA